MNLSMASAQEIRNQSFDSFSETFVLILVKCGDSRLVVGVKLICSTEAILSIPPSNLLMFQGLTTLQKIQT